jgi:hypothetical protein
MEVWKDIKGYEGLYQVSSLGKVKSLERLIWNGYTNHKRKEIMLSLCKCNKGYIVIRLSKNNVQSTYKVHRLVAKAFIKDIKLKPQINHINGIKDDNRVDNLEWCTNSENQSHAVLTGLKKCKYEVHTEKVIKLYKSMTPTYKIADFFDCSRSTIKRILVNNGIKLRKRNEYHI